MTDDYADVLAGEPHPLVDLLEAEHARLREAARRAFARYEERLLASGLRADDDFMVLYDEEAARDD